MVQRPLRPFGVLLLPWLAWRNSVRIQVHSVDAAILNETLTINDLLCPIL
jgi:hypothetical protein